jgi:hypothetical protein
LDRLDLLVHEHGLRPIFLFEYYTRWNGELGGRDKWDSIGRAFAERFRPNSLWLKSQGVTDWGVVYYSAINEPMWQANNPTPIPPEAYAAALEGLADGVHAVDPALKVSPGGYQEVPLFMKKDYGLCMQLDPWTPIRPEYDHHRGAARGRNLDVPGAGVDQRLAAYSTSATAP